MKGKHVIATFAFATAMVLGTAIGVNKNMDSARAATETTVKCAINPETLGTYDMKLNVHMGSNNSDPWGTYLMEEAGTHGNLKLFSCTYTDLWNGVATMQFQLYDGETWKEQKQPISSWTGVSTYNGKIFLYDTEKWEDGEAPVLIDTTLEVNFSAAVPDYADIFLPGSFNSWSEDPAKTKMTRVSDTKFTLGLEDVAVGSYEYKVVACYTGVETMDWNHEIDAGNQSITLKATDDNKIVTLGEARSYDFTKNMVEPSVATLIDVTLEVNFSDEVPDYADIYLPGTFNSWSDDPAKTKMTRVSNTKFTLGLEDVAVGSYSYKVVACYTGVETMDWNHGIDVDDQVVVLAEIDDGETVVLGETRNYDFSKNMPAPEAPAEPDVPEADGYYIVGTESNWKFEGATKMGEGDEQNNAILLGYEAKAEEEIKVRSYLEETDKWYAPGNHDGKEYGEVNEDGNFVFSIAGEYDIYLSKDGMFYVNAPEAEKTYKLRIGEEEIDLVKFNDNEYKAAEVELKSGDILSYTEDGTKVEAKAKNVYNNNLNAEIAVLVDATADIYVDVAAKTIWVGGLPEVGGFNMIVNGKLVPLTAAPEFDGFLQYNSGVVNFKAGDKIRFIDTTLEGLPAVFDITKINETGLGDKFEAVDGVLTAKEAVETQVWLKLKMSLDEVYFGVITEAESKAIEFANNFLSAIREVCDANGNTNQANLEAAWAEQVIAYNALSDEAKAEVKLGGYSIHNEIKEFGDLYVYVLQRRASWNLNNFLDWEISSMNNGNEVMNVNNTALLVTVMASMVLVSALGIFLLKRKNQK